MVAHDGFGTEAVGGACHEMNRVLLGLFNVRIREGRWCVRAVVNVALLLCMCALGKVGMAQLGGSVVCRRGVCNDEKDGRDEWRTLISLVCHFVSNPSNPNGHFTN